MQRLYTHFRGGLLSAVILLVACGTTLAQWTNLPDIPPDSRSWTQSAYLNGKLYAFGGLLVPADGSTNTTTASSIVYDVTAGGAGWTTVADLPEQRAGGYAAAVNGKIYMLAGFYISGSSAVMTPTVVEYDPASNTYTTKASMSTPRYQVSGAVIGTKIYIINGFIPTSGTPTNIVEVYDVTTNQWSTLNNSAAPSAFSACTAVGNTIYVVGGQSTSTSFTSLSNKGTVSGGNITWSAIANFPTPIYRTCAGAINNTIYVAGGSGPNGASNLTYKYDAAGNKWVASYPLPTATVNVSSMTGDTATMFHISGTQVLSVYKFKEGVPTAIANITPLALSATVVKNTTTSGSVNVKNDGLIALTGTVTVPATAPWLTVDKATFNVLPGANTDLKGTLNATGMTAGVYTTDVTIATNDPAKPTVTIKITMTVVDEGTKRLVLIEGATSSTCNPCRPGNTNVIGILNAHDRSQYTVVRYQMSWPGTGDPYCTAEGYNRDLVLQAANLPNLAIPWMNADGANTGDSRYYTTGAFEQEAALISFVKLSATHSIDANHKVTVNVKIDPILDNPSNSLKLFVAINEKHTTQNIKSNGETDFYDVMKKMLPNENGKSIASLTKGTVINVTQNYTFPGTYRLPTDGQPANVINTATENSVEDFGNLEVVVWVQDVNTREVLQSAWSVEGNTAPQNVFSQTIPVTSYTVDPKGQYDFLSTISNISDAPIQLRVTRTGEALPTTGTPWSSSVCFGPFCYPSTASGPFDVLIPAHSDTALSVLFVAGDAKNATATATLKIEAVGSTQAPITRIYTLKTNGGGAGGVLEDLATAGATLALGQNFPNPVSEKTNVSFTLPTASHATLELFNVTGQKVATIFDATSTSGVHSVQYDASDIADGAYTVVLTSNGKKVSRTMTVVH